MVNLGREKRKRYEINAKLKKERLDNEQALVRKKDVVNKVKKIR